MQLSLYRLQVLFFYDESGRAPFVRHLRQAVSDLGREMRVTEMREEELLREATTREQRAQIVETFIRHAFSKVESVALQALPKKNVVRDHGLPVVCDKLAAVTVEVEKPQLLTAGGDDEVMVTCGGQTLSVLWFRSWK